MGLGFLATVRPDGSPRLHPMWPLLTEDELLAFIIPSPKQADLRRDGRYTLHSFPCEDNEDTFSISGPRPAGGRRFDEARPRGAVRPRARNARRADTRPERCSVSL